MISPRLTANLVLANLLAGAALLYRYPPEANTLYPQCPVFRLTHLYCPGCGATRALAALLHCRLVEAFHHNALLVVMSPFLLSYFALAYWKAMTQKRFEWPQIPAPAPKYMLLLASAFALLRNVIQASL
jgi:Protein of unknown function (DUF2752)